MGIPHTLIKTGGIALILLLSIAAGPQAAAEDPPGNNGTVKIHDGTSEAEPIRKNEPHVGCSFHIHGFNFDASSTGTWNIQGWPPTGDRSVVASGTWGAASAAGDWRTAVMSLPAGHYKLNVDQTRPSAPGGEKHKVFWVECQPVTGGVGVGGEESSGGAAGGGQQSAGVVGGQQQAPAVLGVQQAPGAATVSDPAVPTIRSLPSTSTN